jgi:tRNA1Val (adenine37-N6)-methyltransferase
MKVCTDACIFGAWIAKKAYSSGFPIADCLDIGTGTGLLSLMFAQKNPYTKVDALEIEANAHAQANENISHSGWNDRISAFNLDARNFVSEKKYDLIISNPPFYENELSSAEKNKNIAKHDEGLTLKDLITIIKNNLSVTGYFAILLPYHRLKYFEGLAKENNFFLQEKLLIRQTSMHNFFRGILFFSNTKTEQQTTQLTIKIDDEYTKEFIELLKDYYLTL